VNPISLTLAYGNFVIATGALIVTDMLPVLAEGLKTQVAGLESFRHAPVNPRLP
jgi:hypothetical protein